MQKVLQNLISLSTFLISNSEVAIDRGITENKNWVLYFHEQYSKNFGS